jgi:hypothetical protein
VINCCMGVAMRGLFFLFLAGLTTQFRVLGGIYWLILLVSFSFLFLAYLRLDQIRSLAPLLVAIILCCLNLFCATISYWSDKGKNTL